MKVYGSVLLCFVLCIVLAGNAVAQGTPLQSVLADFDAYRKQSLQEKVFLHLDRPLYVCGETMWFKVYEVDGTLHRPLELSKVAYVEVLDEEMKPVMQGKIALKESVGNGSFVVPFTLNSGNYTVRAYTNWMKNFSPDFYFESTVTIINTFKNAGAKPAVAPDAYELQFFPEGGNLVNGLPGRVAFKAVSKRTGKGVVDFEGEIVDKDGKALVQFQPEKFGMGSFTFTPEKGNQYRAVVRVNSRQVLTQQLPVAYEEGYALELQEIDAQQIRITLNASGKEAEQVYLLGHARQMVSVAEEGMLSREQATFIIPKGKLAEGITHFTVFNSKKQPVCERLYFKRPTQHMAIEAQVGAQPLTTRDKVTLELLTRTQQGVALPANLSLSVYRLDSLAEQNTPRIASYLWLTSDLKGTIENPDYYFAEATPATDKAIDLLMLTHGWSRFRWEDMPGAKERELAYLPEMDGHIIRGKITDNTTGGPVYKAETYLGVPGKHVRLYNAISNIKGFFQYEVKDFFGPKDIVVQANSTKDSTYHFEVFNPFSEKYSALLSPTLQLDARLQDGITQRHVEMQLQNNYFAKYRSVFSSPGVDSIAFYGKPNDQYYLDDYIRFKVMEEVMREYVPSVMVRKRQRQFHFMVRDHQYETFLKDDPMVLLDGVPVFNTDRLMAYDPLKIQRMDIVTSRFFSGNIVYHGIVSYHTYKGNMDGFSLDPHALMQEYEGLQLQREFYSPSYASAEEKSTRLADFRNLLYWSPDINTAADGTAKVEFYTSDQPGRYMLVLHGLTKQGMAGSKVLTFEVKQPI